ARTDADSGRKIEILPWLQGGDCCDQVQSGENCPFRIVLVRRRPPEIDQDTVTHELSDKAIKAPYHHGAAALISRDHVPHVLGVKTPSQRGRSNEIDEHHG